MYEAFYNLKAEPFRLSPDHKFCYEHKGYAKARAYMAYAFKRAEGFVMITGRPGTGKTTLVGELVESMSADSVATANLVCTQLQADDLLKTVAYNFGVGSGEMDKAELLQCLTIIFQRWHHEGRRALLIVDEAQDLSVSAMEELRLLTNIQIGGQPLVQIFLLGQPELRDLVMAPEMEQVHQRVIAASHLRGLEVEETEDYVLHRLLTAGWNGDPAIDRAIFPLVHKFSEGVPRRINLICSRLLLLGSVEERHGIDVQDVRVVIGELQAENLAAGTWLSEADFDFTHEPDWLQVPGMAEDEPSGSEPELPALSGESDDASEREAEKDAAAEVAKKKEVPRELKEAASSYPGDEALPEPHEHATPMRGDERSVASSEQSSPLANGVKASPHAAVNVPGGSDSLSVVALAKDVVSPCTTEVVESLDQGIGSGSVVPIAPARDKTASAAVENEYAYVSRDFLDGLDEGDEIDDCTESDDKHPAPKLGGEREDSRRDLGEIHRTNSAQLPDDDLFDAPVAADEANAHLDEDAPGQQWPQTSRREASVASLLEERDVVDNVDAEPLVPAGQAGSRSGGSKARAVIVVLTLLSLIAATVFFLEIFLSRNDKEVRNAFPPTEVAATPVPSAGSAGESDVPVGRQQDDAAPASVELDASDKLITPLRSELDSGQGKSDQEEPALSASDVTESVVESVTAVELDEAEERTVAAGAPEVLAVATAITPAKTSEKRAAAKPKARSLPVLKQVFEIGFPSGGAKLQPKATVVLNKAAEKMQDHPESTAEILAYAVGQGDGVTVGDIYSRRRKAVQNYLVLAGIDQSRLELALENASRAAAEGESSAFVQVVVSRVLRQ